jgi:hypothetical protein
MLAMTDDERWRSALEQHSHPAVKALGEVMVAAAGAAPLLAKPLTWQSTNVERSVVWHGLAVTEHFVVTAESFVAKDTWEAEARVVPFGQVGDVVWKTTKQTGWAGLQSVTMNISGNEVSFPTSAADRAEPSTDERAFIDAVTRHL